MALFPDIKMVKLLGFPQLVFATPAFPLIKYVKRRLFTRAEKSRPRGQKLSYEIA